MEKVKFLNFYRESNKFDDILSDITLKKITHHITIFSNHLRIAIFTNNVNSIMSYVLLKYGDEYRESLCDDHSPKPNVDYLIKKTVTKRRKLHA